MLVRITDYCDMGCTHCMVNASVSGTHMDTDTFRDTLRFTKRYEPALLLSGGEPTQHPDFIEFLGMIRDNNFDVDAVLILSNGTFLEDESYTKEILSFGHGIQITNDPRFYPKTVKRIDHPLIEYEDTIRQISPFGRAIKNGITTTQKYPGCFNLRSIAEICKTFTSAVRRLRLIAQRFCSPSINTNGSISVGETPFCRWIGTIHSADEELITNIKFIHCNNCGLGKNLTGEFAAKWKELNNEKD